MIPTDHKDKLPKGFSYPLGAEKLSMALGDVVPQAESMGLWFLWKDEIWTSNWRKRINDLGVVTLIAASYRKDGLESSRLFGWGDWRLHVYAVPSEYNVAAREFLLGGALKQLATKLREASGKVEFFDERISFHLRDAKPVNAHSHRA
jgi:hypothetical protein